MTRAAALLLLRLLGGAADFRARLLRLGAGTARVAVGNDNLVDQVLAEFAAEHGVGNRQLLFAISDGKFHRRLSLCLARRTDDHVAARRARHGALDRDQAALGVDPDHLEALRALAHGTHVAGHLLARENATGRLPLADRARRAMRQRVAVRRVAHLEVPALDRALATLALGHAVHVHHPPDLEDLDLAHAPNTDPADFLVATAHFPPPPARLATLP